eukprot:6202585-Pleurochrysis_carterae.AAC.1
MPDPALMRQRPAITMSARVAAAAAIAAAAAAAACTLLIQRAIAARSQNCVHALISESRALYSTKKYPEALQAASSAREAACAILQERADVFEGAMIHLAGVYAAMRNRVEALAVIDQCLSIVKPLHGDTSLRLVPLLHARAEVLEEEERMQEAIYALEDARQ